MKFVAVIEKSSNLLVQKPNLALMTENLQS